MTSLFTRVCASAVALLLVCVGARGQTSYPFLCSLSPCGLQRGTTADVLLSGKHNFHRAYQVIIEGESVRGEVLAPPDGWPPKDSKTGKTLEVNEIKLRITAASDAVQGVRELRVVTPRGVSSVGQIVVGDLPEKQEQEPNEDLAHAQAVALPVTMNGRLEKSEDADNYRFRARANEQLTFSVLCARLEDKTHELPQHADPMLTLYDARGRELAENDDFQGADPLLHYRFSQEGEYVLQIRDATYAGNPHWTYRLSITGGPFVTSLFPIGVSSRGKQEVTPLGFGLPDGPLPLELPPDASPGTRVLSLPMKNGATNPVPLLVTDLPIKTLLVSPDFRSPPHLPVPAARNARLAAPGERHRYRFRAKKGQTYVFEVSARRFGSELDSVLKLCKTNGDVLTSNDDIMGALSSSDSRLEWAAGEEGDYLIEVSDLHGRGGSAFSYCLTARAVTPDFYLHCDDDKMNLAPGSRGTWYALVTRKFGFEGEVKIEARGLPPGVAAAPLTIPPGVRHGCLVFSCAPNAALSAGVVEVIGTAILPGPDGKPTAVTRKATPLSEINILNQERGRYPVNTQVVAVTEAGDIILEASATQVALKPGGTARVEVTIQRASGFTGRVGLDVCLKYFGSVYCNPLPRGVSLDEGASKLWIEENETRGYLVLKAEADAPPIPNLPIVALGAVQINYVIKVNYSTPPIYLTVTKAPTPQ